MPGNRLLGASKGGKALNVHHGKLTASRLEHHKDKMEVFFLPPYVPEYNPYEYLSHALKASVHSGHPRLLHWKVAKNFCPLVKRGQKGWSWRPDLNRRPTHYECVALPTELHQQVYYCQNTWVFYTTKVHLSRQKYYWAEYGIQQRQLLCITESIDFLLRYCVTENKEWNPFR